MNRIEPSRWLRIIQTNLFLRKWSGLGLGDEDLRALELEILKGPELHPMSKATERGVKKPTQTTRPAKGRGNGTVRAARRSTVGAEILEALQEVRDALSSGEPLERRFTVRSYRFDFTARDYGPAEVRLV